MTKEKLSVCLLNDSFPPQIDGVANAVLREATESAQAVIDKLTIIREELRAAMLLTGSADLAALAKARHVVLGQTRQWIDAL